MKKLLLSIIISLFLCTGVYAGPWISGGSGSGDAELAAIAGLTFADKSMIQLTGAGAASVLTCASANQLIGVNAANDALECKSTINVTIDDSAAQFTSATASKGTRKLVQSSIDNGILLTDTPVITGNVTWTNISQGAGTYTRVFEEALNVFTVKQEFDATAGLQVGSTGVLITSDNDGAITFLGASGGYDEDLTINLDDTENTAVVSSSTGVTKIDTGSIAFATTGYIQGAIKVATDADGMDATATAAAGMYGTLFVATGAGTWTMPAAAEGMNFCLLSTTAAEIIIDIDASDDITLAGVQDTDGDGVTNASGEAAGDFICMIAIDATHWYVFGKQGTWAAQ